MSKPSMLPSPYSVIWNGPIDRISVDPGAPASGLTGPLFKKTGLFHAGARSHQQLAGLQWSMAGPQAPELDDALRPPSIEPLNTGAKPPPKVRKLVVCP